MFDVTDGNGYGILFELKSFILTFEGDYVIMDIERDERTLAGISSGRIMTGSYTLS